MSAVAAGWTSEGSLEGLFCNPEAGGAQVTCRPGEVIFDPEARAENVFYIHSGQVRLHQIGSEGVAMLLEILSPGQWFGAAALAGRGAQGLRATAFVTTKLTKVGAASMMRNVCASPDGASALVRELAGKVVAASEDAARLVFDDCNARLIKTLVRFSNTSAASPRPDAEGVVLHITHEHLAEALGVARETVSLALTQLRKQNVLQTGRNKLVFDPNVLKSFQTSAKKTAVAES